jgi:Domain of unknown function (DUF4149)
VNRDTVVSAPVVQTIVLSLWLGGAALFTTVVAPAAFAVLPSRALAGVLVGRVLPVVFWSGIAAGLVSVALDALIRRGSTWGTRDLVSPALIAACAVAQLGIGPRIARIRQEIGGPIEQLAADDVRRVAFGRLHAASVVWLGVAMIAAATAVVIAVRTIQARR